MPLVSVVIPTLNRPQLVVRAVRSVLAQTMPDFEVLVLIDGRDPATEAALDGLAEPRLKILSNPQNLGAGRTRDLGASLATADWVAFLDDDDEWLPQKIEKQLALTADGPAVITALSRVIAPYGESQLPVRPYDGTVPFDEWMFDRRSWLKRGEGFFQTSALMAPKAMFQIIGFRDVRHEDWEIGLRAVKELGYPLRTVPEPLVLHYRDQDRPSLSHDFSWKRSVGWADDLGTLMSRRAYSGFVLTVVSKDAHSKGAYSAALPLLGAAYRRGSPTLRQLFSYGLVWTIPRGLRKFIRAGIEQRGPRRHGDN